MLNPVIYSELMGTAAGWRLHCWGQKYKQMQQQRGQKNHHAEPAMPAAADARVKYAKEDIGNIEPPFHKNRSKPGGKKWQSDNISDYMRTGQ